MRKTAGSTCSSHRVSIASFHVESITQYAYISHHASQIRDRKATLGHRDFTTDKCGTHTQFQQLLVQWYITFLLHFLRAAITFLLIF